MAVAVKKATRREEGSEAEGTTVGEVCTSANRRNSRRNGGLAERGELQAVGQVGR